MEYLAKVKFEAIWARTVDLARRFKDGLVKIPGIKLYTPCASEQSAALVSFGIAGWKGRGIEPGTEGKVEPDYQGTTARAQRVAC